MTGYSEVYQSGARKQDCREAMNPLFITLTTAGEAGCRMRWQFIHNGRAVALGSRAAEYRHNLQDKLLRAFRGMFGLNLVPYYTDICYK